MDAFKDIQISMLQLASLSPLALSVFTKSLVEKNQENVHILTCLALK